MADRTDLFSRRISALAPKYLAAIETRRNATIERLASHKSTGEIKYLLDCRSDAHKTAGTAATFGYVSLGKIAREVCEALNVDPNSTGFAVDAVDQLSTFVRELTRVIAR